ncbi:enoyl-CoA hydratase-related protein [Amycolatopsis sp. NPDC004378]
MDEVSVVVDGPKTTIAFSRPKALNALTTSMLDHAADVVETAASGTRVIVLTGAGRAFSAGADLGAEPGERTIAAANRLTSAIVHSPKVVVAAVNGPAVGVACSFALAADVAVAASSAYFLLGFATVGLMPDGGATALLPAAVGRARAGRMMFLQDRIPARLAEEWGMIARAVPDDQFAGFVDEFAERFANGPALAHAQAKKAMNAAVLDRLDDALEREAAGQSALFATGDHREGAAAFRAHRPPRFTGRP